MNKLLLFLPLLLFVALAGFLFYALEIRKDRPSDELTSALLDKPFPAFNLVTLDGKPIDSSQLTANKVTLVNVWASWCPSCVDEHEFLADLANSGVRIVGLNYKDTEEKATAWLNRYGDFYRFHIFDSAGRLGLDLGVYGAPETYLVDALGIIRYKRVGVVDDRIWKEIKPLYDELVANAAAVDKAAEKAVENLKHAN